MPWANNTTFSGASTSSIFVPGTFGTSDMTSHAAAAAADQWGSFEGGRSLMRTGSMVSSSISDTSTGGSEVDCALSFGSESQLSPAMSRPMTPYSSLGTHHDQHQYNHHQPLMCQRVTGLSFMHSPEQQLHSQASTNQLQSDPDTSLFPATTGTLSDYTDQATCIPLSTLGMNQPHSDYFTPPSQELSLCPPAASDNQPFTSGQLQPVVQFAHIYHADDKDDDMITPVALKREQLRDFDSENELDPENESELELYDAENANENNQQLYFMPSSAKDKDATIGSLTTPLASAAPSFLAVDAHVNMTADCHYDHDRDAPRWSSISPGASSKPSSDASFASSHHSVTSLASTMSLTSPPVTTAVMKTSTDSSPLASNSAQRRANKDAILVHWKRAGMSYKEIKERGNFQEAESTLRGRFRTLTKSKELRVRKPRWEKRDVRGLPCPPFVGLLFRC